MKVLITGGHFSPAFAVYKELKSQGHEVAFAARKYVFENDRSESFEYKTLKEAKVKVYELSTGRVQRRFSLDTLPSIAKIPSGFFNSIKILRDFRPDVVLTFGGYLSFPIAYAAYTMRIPVFLHEQTQEAGLAARAIAPITRKIFISFETSGKYFPTNKTILTGNPVRSQIYDKGDLNLDGKVIYVTGGSSGSHFINEVIRKILPELVKDYVVIHQTGENVFNDYERLAEEKEALPRGIKNRYIVSKFIDAGAVGPILNRADLILTRAGINIVSEILALQKVALLIPLPHGQAGEQLANARLLVSHGVAEFIEEKDATAEKILEKINMMFENLSYYKKKAKAARFPNSAKKIVEYMLKYAQKTN